MERQEAPAPIADGPTDRSASAFAELFRHKGVLTGILIGLVCGTASTIGYSTGIFIAPLEQDFGWTRASISFAVTMFTLAFFVAGPLAGILVDRFGVRGVAVASLIGLGAALAMLPLVLTQVHVLWAAYFLIGVIGIGSTPITLLKPITVQFGAHRGLAIGLVLMGLGFSGFWVPRFVAWLVEAGGWQTGYRGLALISILAAPIVWLLIPRTVGAGKDIPKTAMIYGLSLTDGWKTYRFWLLTLICCTMGLGIGGMIVHLVPLFRDFGASPRGAAEIASALGLSSVAGRLIMGFGLDWVKGPQLGLVVFMISAAGMGLIWLSGLDYALLAVLLIGFGLGAESDLIAYYISRYFGLRAYSAIFGFLYGIYAMSTGLSPFMVALMRDGLGSYDVSVIVCATLTATAGLLTLALGPYRYAAKAAG